LLLYVLVTSGTFTTTATHTLSGGTSGATAGVPTALGADNSPDGSSRTFTLTNFSATEADNDEQLKMLIVTRNGVVQNLYGFGAGTGNDFVGVGTADPDFFYFHTAGGSQGTIEFQVAPAVDDLIEVNYMGFAA
jgi:hypothetical protein